MPATSYQINRDMRGNTHVQREAFTIISSVVENATVAYGLSIQDISLDGAGRLRIRLSDALPVAEVESFGGDLIVL